MNSIQRVVTDVVKAFSSVKVGVHVLKTARQAATNAQHLFVIVLIRQLVQSMKSARNVGILCFQKSYL